MSIFGAMGVQAIQIGKKIIPVSQPPSAKQIKGFGDTIKLGDIFFEQFTEPELGASWEDKGPFRLDAVSTDASDPWYRFTSINGDVPCADWRGDGWQRKFKLADKETAKKVRAALQFEGMYVRLYVVFKGKNKGKDWENKTWTLIPACWIAWVGDLQKAFLSHHTQFGILKKKNIVRWINTGLFTDGTMKSKVPIPADFPVSLK